VRAILVAAVIAIGAPGSADVTVVAGAGASRLARCAATVRASLRDRYPRDDDWDEGGSCELHMKPTSLTLSCYGACNDRSCHNDACTGHDEDLDIELAFEDGPSSLWTRDDTHRDWRLDWRRRYGPVLAIITQYRSRYARHASPVVVRRVQQTLDGCLVDQ